MLPMTRRYPSAPSAVPSRARRRLAPWDLPLLALLAMAFGCGAPNRAKWTEEVLKADPGFRKLLDQRDEYASQAATAEREFALKRDTIQRTIEKLRGDLAESRRTLERKRAHFQELLEPDRRKLEFDRSMAAEELRTKRTQRASIGRSIARLRKTLKQANAEWSSQERQQQDHQLKELTEETRRLDEELAALQRHLDLLKRKLLLLQL